MKKLVIFDLDGTLLNTLPDLTDCMNLMLKQVGLPLITEEQARQYIGHGSKYFVKCAIGEKNQHRLEECHRIYSELYRDYESPKTAVYEHIDELLVKLKKMGIKIAIVSNKPQDALDTVYKKLLSKYKFDYVYGQRECFYPKPDPRCVMHVIEKLGVNKENCIYVGDSDVDVQTAKNAEINCVSVAWGYRDEEILHKAGAKFIAKNADQLFANIIFLYGRKKMKKFFNEFKQFISRGNVLDMAVGVIVGSAFTAIVNALSQNILKPIINWILSLCLGQNSLDGIYTYLTKAFVEGTNEIDLANSIYIDWGAFINAIINFLLIAFVVFTIVKLINKAKELGDYNANMANTIQKKLDNDEKLNSMEEKWMEHMQKKNPDMVPKKTVIVEEAPAEPEISSTDKLLMEILEQLKKD